MEVHAFVLRIWSDKLLQRGMLFLEDCLDIQRKFPGINRCFNDGGWVMYHTLRQGSAVRFDMALEKCYNKPANVAGGIIRMTRQKEAVA